MGSRIGSIKLAVFREFLEAQGCKHIRDKGGHEIWSRKDLSRPITIQHHFKEIPEAVVRSNLRTLGVEFQDFVNWLNK